MNRWLCHHLKFKKNGTNEFWGVTENVVTREEFPLEKAREVLKTKQSL